MFLHEGDVGTVPPYMPANCVKSPMKSKLLWGSGLSDRLMSYQCLMLMIFVLSTRSVRPQYTEIRLITNLSNCGSCLRKNMAKPQETATLSRNRGKRRMTRLVVIHDRN
jgi:hypothetical protein